MYFLALHIVLDLIELTTFEQAFIMNLLEQLLPMYSKAVATKDWLKYWNNKLIIYSELRVLILQFKIRLFCFFVDFK